MHVLLIEDEPAIRTALSRALGRWGHEVVSADCIAAAREVAQEKAPEAVISDLKLPDGSGLDLAIDLGLPFILMSGYGNFDDAVLALRNGCVDFLTKPVALEQLKAALQRLAERRTQSATALIAGPAQCQVVQPLSCDLVSEDLHISDLRWSSDQEAQQCFATISGDSGDLALRQLCAELMQIPGAQRLVINQDGQGWRCWLPVAGDWEASEHADRRTLIEHLASRCWWRPQGILVELCHEH